MTFTTSVKYFLCLSSTCCKIKRQITQCFVGCRHSRKESAALLLVFLFSILSVSSLQACQLKADSKEIVSMNQKSGIPELPTGVELIRDTSNGTIRILKGIGLTTSLMEDENFNKAVTSGTPDEISIAFISAYRRLFKLQDPINELKVSKIQTDSLGMTHVRLTQQYKGIEVWPADINVHLNQDGDVYLVQGRYAKTPSDVVQHARLDEVDALGVVSKDVGMAIDNLRNFRTKLIIYCGLSDSPRLAYQIDADISVDNAWQYVVDAQNGKILEKTSAIQNQGRGRQPSHGKIILK